MAFSRSTVLPWLLALTTAACQYHAPRPAVLPRVSIDDRGISIPVPPPSALASPIQPATLMGTLEEAGTLDRSWTVVLYEHVRDEQSTVTVREADFAAELELDLSDNCVEVWVENAQGEAGPERWYRAEIVADEVLIREGCEAPPTE